MLHPLNGAGMSIRNAGEPLTVLVLSLYLFRAIGSSPIPSTSVYVDARVTRVVQHAHSARRRQRLEHCGAAETSRWKTKAFLPKHLHRLDSRAAREGRLEEVGDRLSDLRVRVEHHVASLIVGKARGQRTTILAASHLIEDSAAQPGFEDVKLGFAHCSFETEQQTVVEVCRFVDPILVEDQGVGQRADLQQAVPISAVPRQARNFEPHDDAGVAHPHIRDHTLKALAPRTRCAPHALIAITHDDLILVPAARDGPAATGRLTISTFYIIDKLAHG